MRLVEHNRCLTDHQGSFIVRLLLGFGPVSLEYEQRLVWVSEHSRLPGITKQRGHGGQRFL